MKKEGSKATHKKAADENQRFFYGGIKQGICHTPVSHDKGINKKNLIVI
jgi:hypothetical protein